MGGQLQPYIAYLLRLWLAPGDQRSGWRASLEDPHTGDRVGFGSLEQLFAFLAEQAADAEQRSNGTKGGGNTA
jgi:hypothetical protein